MSCYSLLYYLSFFTLYWLNALRCRCTLSDFPCIRNWKNSALINEWIWCILMLKLLSAGLTHVLADETGIWMLNTLFAVCLIFKCCPLRPSFPGKMVENIPQCCILGNLILRVPWCDCDTTRFQLPLVVTSHCLSETKNSNVWGQQAMVMVDHW
jgi:hypothetical protein